MCSLPATSGQLNGTDGDKGPTRFIHPGDKDADGRTQAHDTCKGPGGHSHPAGRLQAQAFPRAPPGQADRTDAREKVTSGLNLRSHRTRKAPAVTSRLTVSSQRGEEPAAALNQRTRKHLWLQLNLRTAPGKMPGTSKMSGGDTASGAGCAVVLRVCARLRNGLSCTAGRHPPQPPETAQ